MQTLRRLCQSPSGFKMSDLIVGVPKVIYALWLQGKEQAPDLVRLNFERWAALNPDYQLKILDRNDVELMFDGVELPIADLRPQALAELVRVRLLLDWGGIWTDASVFPIKPLDDWLPGMLTEAGFFAFERPGPDRPISSWFLVSTPKNVILRKWWEEITRFWSKPRRLVKGIPADPVGSVSPEIAAANDEYPYYWLQYLFQYLVENDPEFAALWSRCVKSSADPPHRLQMLFAADRHPWKAQIRQAANCAPVQKLNWRAKYPLKALARLT